MAKKAGKIYVVGHKNPDTDSICSAIAYANLKREITGNDYIAKRAGQINEETHYVLQKFGVKVPNLLENVKLQVKDMDIHQIDGVGPNVSLKDTWTKMKENNIKTLPILRDEELLGVISTGDIATSYMDVYDNMILSKARTQYRNIMNTLDGEMVTGNEHGYFTKGKVAIGASSPELMQEFIEKDDLVILGNRVESQMCALDIDVSCMVVCQNAEVSEEVIKRADEQSTVIISTPHDTFTAARLINQSVPVKRFMTKTPLTCFHMSDYVEDIKEVMAKVEEMHAAAAAETAKPAEEAAEDDGIDLEPKAEITYDDFAKLQFQIGEIVKCEAVSKSKKLLCSQVKIGTKTRQIVSGIKAHYSPEEMVGKKVMVVTNLKPAKLAGVVSEGMILCAEDAEGNLSLMVPEKKMPAGAEIC